MTRESERTPHDDEARGDMALAARRAESDALYTAQTNYVQATFFRRLHYAVGLPAVLAAGAATASIITEASAEVAALFGLTASLLTAVQVFVNPEKQALEHNLQGAEYGAFQRRCNRFRTIDLPRLGLVEARDELERLAADHAALNRSNRPSERAFKKAQKKIRRGDPLHPGDEELV
ncbi:MAG TPA: SLATT domain-containing protein [Solirubrobacteraceae bacterium]|jgi:hypothetical protein